MGPPRGLRDRFPVADGGFHFSFLSACVSFTEACALSSNSQDLPVRR